MSATKWTERYNFLRFWASVIWGGFLGTIFLLVVIAMVS